MGSICEISLKKNFETQVKLICNSTQIPLLLVKLKTNLDVAEGKNEVIIVTHTCTLQKVSKRD